VLRFFLLSSHYRGPINYSEAQLAQADETLLGLYRALEGLGEVPGAVPVVRSAADGVPPGAASAGGAASELARDDTWARFNAAMDDDFNTPDALAVMQGVTRELNIAKAAGKSAQAAELAATLRGMGLVLGILQQPPHVYLRRGSGSGSAALSDAEIETLLNARRTARAAKDFAESDRIRDVLATAGILLEDKAGGATRWSRAAPAGPAVSK
jgi:cysteinyl-tRNA synthetase